MILFSFVWLLFYTLILMWQVTERKGEAILGQPGSTEECPPQKNWRNQKLEETREEQLKAIPGERSGLTSRCQMEAQLIQNGIWGKKREAVRVNELIL